MHDENDIYFLLLITHFIVFDELCEDLNMEKESLVREEGYKAETTNVPKTLH
jgi:hypothetical protein